MPDGTRQILRSPEVVGRLIDGELVLVDLHTNDIFTLSETAARAWELLEAEVEESALARSIATMYGKDEATVAGELAILIDALAAAGLVTVVSA